MSTGKLVKKIFIEGKIEAKTGLHIGGSNTGISIGGVEATVVRNPVTNQPYIPGSSLKGKMRSLLEKLDGNFSENGPVTFGPLVDDINNPICRIFGTMPEKVKHQKPQPVTRLIVRDCELDEDGVRKLGKSKNTDMPFTEVKTEVVIDRVTSAAVPRPLERVPAGATFDMRLVLNVFDDDNDLDFLKKIFESLSLVQNDYLGGKGTRGSGEVDITIKTIRYKTKLEYEERDDKDGKPYPDFESIIPESLKPKKDNEEQ